MLLANSVKPNEIAPEAVASSVLYCYTKCKKHLATGCWIGFLWYTVINQRILISRLNNHWCYRTILLHRLNVQKMSTNIAPLENRSTAIQTVRYRLVQCANTINLFSKRGLHREYHAIFVWSFTFFSFWCSCFRHAKHYFTCTVPGCIIWQACNFCSLVVSKIHWLLYTNHWLKFDYFILMTG